jgi:predicted MPP superfamily phosphohydrolase
LSLVTRRRFLQGALAAAGAGAAGVGTYAVEFEPNQPRLLRVEIALARLDAAFDGFTIAQLSDFHYDHRFSVVPIRKAVEIVNRVRPHLVVLTGDFVTVPFFNEHRKAAAASTAAPCAELLGRLNPSIAKFAILGNHDVGSDPALITQALREQGIPVLKNGSLPIEQGNARLWLAGIDDALVGHPDLGRALKHVPGGEPVVLLAHEPDFGDETAQHRVDLQLSGHSHGGQIWIPGLGAPWLPPLGRKYPRGTYRLGDLIVYTNIGIGTIRAPIRFNCPPEVTLFTLRSPKAV